jgi:two-component sensor histidine kinase
MNISTSPFVDLSGLSRVNQGTHYSHFYENRHDLAAAVVPFIATGLSNDERCLWVTAEPLGRDDALDALAAVVPDLSRRLEQGQIEVIEHETWYRAAGGFHAPTVIAAWLERERQALDCGYRGLRITGNTFWLDTPKDFSDFADYERTLHQTLKGHRITCLCSYCLNRCSGSVLLDVVRQHDFAMVHRGGQWEVIESAAVAAAKADLAERLARKDRLLSEVHHRVKNNLQIVSSLLTLKAPAFGGPSAGEAMADTLARIRAMALVHQMLYEQDDGGAIHFGSYLTRLVEQLATAYGCGDRIALVARATAGAMIDLDAAIPLAIAVSEAITNAIKHAFPDQGRGEILLSLEKDRQGLLLTVKDNGRGMPETPPPSRLGAGLSLIRALAEQANSHVELRSGVGLEVRFRIGDLQAGG